MSWKIKDLKVNRPLWRPYLSKSHAKRASRRMNRRAQQHRYEVVQSVQSIASSAIMG